MPSYRVKIVVKEIRGRCALGYKPTNKGVLPPDMIENIYRAHKECEHRIGASSFFLAPPLLSEQFLPMRS